MTRWVTIPVNKTSETADKERLQVSHMTLFKACAACIIGWKGTIHLMKGDLDL